MLERIEQVGSGDILIRINQDAEKALGIYGKSFNLVFLLNGSLIFFDFFSHAFLCRT